MKKNKKTAIMIANKLYGWGMAVILGAGVLAYIMWPVDFFPDTFSVVGFMDDVVIAIIAFFIVSRQLKKGKK